jgi:hypothetical protein
MKNHRLPRKVKKRLRKALDDAGVRHQEKWLIELGHQKSFWAMAGYVGEDDK